MNLKQRWIHALDAAAQAVRDASSVGGLPADEGRARLGRLHAERAWLEAFGWRIV